MDSNNYSSSYLNTDDNSDNLQLIQDQTLIDKSALQKSNIKLPTFFTKYKFTRVSSRYYFPDFISDLTTNSIIINVQTNSESIVYEVLDPMDTMELQSIDFGGTVGLRLIDNTPIIKLGCNELIYQQEDDSLIVHEMNFVHFINRGKYDSAMTELYYIGLWAEKKRDLDGVLNHLIAQGIFYETQDKHTMAKDYYSQALSYLEENLTTEERESKAKFMLKKMDLAITENFNWNDPVDGMIFDRSVTNPHLLKVLQIKAGMPVSSDKPPDIIAELLGIKPVTKMPGRFSVKLFTNDIKPNSIVLNNVSGEQVVISELLQPMDTIDIQALDFAGLLFIKLDSNGKSKVNFAINELSTGIEDDSLQTHQMIFCNAIQKSMEQLALSEINRIRIMTKNKVTIREEFFYMVAQARTLMRMRERTRRMESLQAFESALDFLHTNFAEKEIEQLSIERAKQNGYDDISNWDSFIFGYDEVSALTYYTGAALLLNVATSENEYGRLMEQALEKAMFHDMPLFVVYILHNTGEMLTNEGKFTEAINKYEELLSYVKDLENTTQEFYMAAYPWESVKSLIKLYLCINNIPKAMDIITSISTDYPYQEEPDFRLTYLLGKMYVSNHRGDINASIDDGMKIYDFILEIDSELTLVSKIQYMNPIYTMLIQAIYLDRSDILTKYDEIVANVFEANFDIIDSDILLKLLGLYRLQINFGKSETNRSIDVESYREILNDYNKILGSEELSLYSLERTIIQYLNFAISYFDLLPELRSQIIAQTSDFTELLVDSTNVLLTIKIHIINMVLSERIGELLDWLAVIDNNYQLPPLRDIIIKINDLDQNNNIKDIKDITDITDIKVTMLEILKNDLISEQYSMYQNQPSGLMSFASIRVNKHKVDRSKR